MKSTVTQIHDSRDILSQIRGGASEDLTRRQGFGLQNELDRHVIMLSYCSKINRKEALSSRTQVYLRNGDFVPRLDQLPRRALECRHKLNSADDGQVRDFLPKTTAVDERFSS